MLLLLRPFRHANAIKVRSHQLPPEIHKPPDLLVLLKTPVNNLAVLGSLYSVERLLPALLELRRDKIAQIGEEPHAVPPQDSSGLEVVNVGVVMDVDGDGEGKVGEDGGAVQEVKQHLGEEGVKKVPVLTVWMGRRRVGGWREVFGEREVVAYPE